MEVPVTVVHDTVENWFAAKQGVDVEVHGPRTSILTVDGVPQPEQFVDTVSWDVSDRVTYRWHVYEDKDHPCLTHGALVEWRKDARDPDHHYIGTTTIIETVMEIAQTDLMLCLEAFATTLQRVTSH